MISVAALVLALVAALGYVWVYAGELGEAHRLEEETGLDCGVTVEAIWPLVVCNPRGS
jgi:hypothetical protein